MQTKTLVSEPLWKKYLKICMTKVPKNQRYVVSFKILLFSPVCCKKKLKITWSRFCYIIKQWILIFLLQVVARKYDDWLQSYDKNAKTPDRYEFFIITFKLVQNNKKERKINKMLFVNMFSIYLFMC
jgi:hypothetical protein